MVVIYQVWVLETELRSSEKELIILNVKMLEISIDKNTTHEGRSMRIRKISKENEDMKKIKQKCRIVPGGSSSRY